MRAQSLRSTRTVLPLAIALSLAIGVAIALTSARAGTMPVHAADNPRAFVSDWMRSQGSNCSEATDLTYYMPVTYDLVDKAPAGEGWLAPDSDGAYIGDISGAPARIAEAQLARTASEAWIMGKDDKGLVANHYEKMTTPKGRTFWMRTSWERPAAC